MAKLVTLALLAAMLVAVPAHASTATTVGRGYAPGVAVDAAGTAYIAWVGEEAGTTSLNFCRLPRGAAACDVAHPIVTPATALHRPFVTVSGPGCGSSPTATGSRPEPSSASTNSRQPTAARSSTPVTRSA